MSFYPATVVSVDSKTAAVRIDATGHVIKFAHEEHNAISPELRIVGATGMISFPKVPARFARAAA